MRKDRKELDAPGMGRPKNPLDTLVYCPPPENPYKNIDQEGEVPRKVGEPREMGPEDVIKSFVSGQLRISPGISNDELVRNIQEEFGLERVFVQDQRRLRSVGVSEADAKLLERRFGGAKLEGRSEPLLSFRGRDEELEELPGVIVYRIFDPGEGLFGQGEGPSRWGPGGP